MAFTFNGESISLGETKRFDLPVAHSAGGQHIHIPVHAIAGLETGPVVLVAAGSHGEELWSTEFTRRVHAHFEGRKDELKGMLLIAPVLSPTSFEAGIRNTPFDYHNLNRVFPGAPAGVGWYTEMLADVITEKLLPNADVLFDYHGGGSDTVIDYQYTVGSDDPFYEKIHGAALVSNAEVLWEVKETRSTLSTQFSQLGKPAVIAEVGGGGAILDESWFDRALQTFENWLKIFGALNGEPIAKSPRIVVKKGGTVRPKHGGIFLPIVGLEMLGKQVAGGTILARVVSPYTFETLDELVAPFPKTELLQIRNRISVVQPGDYAYIIGDGDSGNTL